MVEGESAIMESSIENASRRSSLILNNEPSKRGSKPMSDDLYLRNAMQNLKRIDSLMALEKSKSDKWWRFRRQYISQEVRLQERLEIKKREYLT